MVCIVVDLSDRKNPKITYCGERGEGRAALKETVNGGASYAEMHLLGLPFKKGYGVKKEAAKVEAPVVEEKPKQAKKTTKKASSKA
jgi:hypothetical protein